MPTRYTAFTLVELMTALAISLILLLGVIELFRSVGGTIQETTASLNMSANLNFAAVQLRSDLEKINPKLAHQPYSMVHSDNYDEQGGYLEIIEGMNKPWYDANVSGGTHTLMENIALNSDTNTQDLTVGDVDDILMFTASAPPENPFRGMVDNKMLDSNNAEIIYFVRGNTLYRRVLLINPMPPDPPIATNGYTDDFSIYNSDGTTLQYNALDFLKDRRNRSFHYNNAVSNFPFPIYENIPKDPWYYLRLPTLEETLSTGTAWSINNTGGLSGVLPGVSGMVSSATTPFTPYLDLWNNPNSIKDGTNNFISVLDRKDNTNFLLKNYVSYPPNLPVQRAGEDIILKNVLSFDVKVWNPYWVPLTNATSSYAPPQYVDLGQDNCLEDENGKRYKDDANGHPDLSNPNSVLRNQTLTGKYGYGFTTKGHYAGSGMQGYTNVASTIDYSTAVPKVANGVWTGVIMPCVFDSWTIKYEEDPVQYGGRTSINGYTGVPLRPGYGTTGGGTDDGTEFVPSDPPGKNKPKTDANNWECPPPYDEELTSIQITIRCFDPDSKQIRQVSVVHHFP